MSPVDVLLTVGAATTALGVVGSAAWWVLKPRFVELVRTITQAASASATAAKQLTPNSGTSHADRVTQIGAQVSVNTRRLDDLDTKVDAIGDGMQWAGRTLDHLANALDRVARLQQQHLAESRTRHRRFDEEHPDPWQEGDEG